jgi:D-sedoheptulose 7-phosphate isomerase
MSTVTPETPTAGPVAPDTPRAAIRELAETATRTADRLGDDVARAAALVRDRARAGRTLYFCGNGGSAADARQPATEYVVRYRRNRRAYPAVALTTDTSPLTACRNDFGLDHVFEPQVQALCGAGDVLVIHSMSGDSPDVLVAARAARDGGALRELADVNVIIPTDPTDRARELHLCVGHLICDLVGAEL